jgi:hypothetical protein
MKINLLFVILAGARGMLPENITYCYTIRK